MRQTRSGYNWFPDSKRLVLSIAKPFEHGKLHRIDAAADSKPKAMDFPFFVNSIDWSPNGKQTIDTGLMWARGKQEAISG